ncbi:hypothetical protein CDL15_Pgr022160 [Punica granatum]|uniref:RING-type E3 ubiquitin transferase n=1 Tax=Punica granatum TaxID=22663 RepID=A0A218VSD3_PUNGR|nr:hypothetical protein CDL15_Pgr022160 [Punica granatum]
MASFCGGKGLFSLKANLEKEFFTVRRPTSNIDHDEGAFFNMGEQHEPIGRGASLYAISRLLECAKEGCHDLASPNLDSCPICLGVMAGCKRQRLLEMPCNHVFHSPCIVRWLETSNSCPLYRFRLEDNNI